MTDLQDTRGGHEHPHSPAIIWGGVGGDGVIIGEGPLTQTLDTLRRGKVFRMAWVGGGGGLTCVRGVSVCVCGGGGHIFACTSGREGWGCTAARATLDIHRHEVLDEFFSVPSDEAVALHGTLRLHNATYVHAKR